MKEMGVIRGFKTGAGDVVPAVTAEQMRDIDRIAVEEFGLGILQMMENAGRSLAENVLDMLPNPTDSGVVVFAGSGGNGGGGLCCARHLHNRGVAVKVILDREAERLTGAAHSQWQILQTSGIRPTPVGESRDALRRSNLAVDALIGYGLRGVPRRRTAELIAACNLYAPQVLSLDIPSGVHATTGEAPGKAIRADRTLTLALPKTGLQQLPGDLYLADIGIPPEVFHRLGLSYTSPFRDHYWIPLCMEESSLSSREPHRNDDN